MNPPIHLLKIRLQHNVCGTNSFSGMSGLLAGGYIP